MPGEAEHINVHGLHVNGDGPCRLGGVHYQQGPLPVGDLTDAGEIQYIACQVGGVGADHGPGLGAHKALKRPVVHPPQPVRRDNPQRYAPFLLQPVQRPQD